jgi:anti-sigma factor RsiW
MNEHDDAQLTALLKKHYDPVATEPIPARMYLRSPRWIGFARGAALVLAGIAIGFGMYPYVRPVVAPRAEAAAVHPFAVRAARAHAMYAAEVRHPIEVRATEEHLVRWLSRRLNYNLKVPVLAEEGFELLGGRLLPGGDGGAVALFMYQDGSGKRLTLQVTRRAKAEQLTAFRFAKEGNVTVFYWIDRDCGYALSGDLDRTALTRIATAVYKQLEQ